MNEPIVIRIPEWVWPVINVGFLLILALLWGFLCWYCRWYERRHRRDKQ